ncbi:MAG: DedA family protein [bacterium]|nr:DedA family protein [bacterium]
MQWIRRLYDWVLHWAETPYASWALFWLAFAESSFFPVPPDVLLIALSISIPKKAFRYAAICSVGSVIGGIFGYFLGYAFFDLLGKPILSWYGYGAQEKYQLIQQLYQKYDFWAVSIAGFTPIPYKVFTIAAGVFQINFGMFCFASLLSRSARFFLVAALLWKFGPPIRYFIEKYFNLLTIIFVLLVILGFIILKYYI